MARRHPSEGVQLNVTAMLDMAFQLLAFFVLTFRPDPAETGVLLRLPSAQPVVVESPIPPGPEHFTSAGLNTLRIGLFSTSGDLDRMTIDNLPVDTFDVLRDYMRQKLTDPNSPIEQVVVQASDGLRYDEVMKVVGICSEQKLPKSGKYVNVSMAVLENGQGN
jgi:biopolymer transport protein ExbD